MNEQNRGHDVNLDSESVAGEEDPGASLDLPVAATRSSSGQAADAAASKPFNPGDATPDGTPGPVKVICRD